MDCPCVVEVGCPADLLHWHGMPIRGLMALEGLMGGVTGRSTGLALWLLWSVFLNDWLAGWLKVLMMSPLVLAGM
jgi:hypothetical protein